MTRLGLDYAWATLSPAAHKSVGSSFACRYLSNDPSKNLTSGEAHTLRSGGVDVVVVWETTATRALAGGGAGAADAHNALNEAQACGIPAHRPIYFAVDFDASQPQQGAIDAYFKGVASVLGVERTGVYGGYWPLKRLFDSRLVGYGWQTYAWSGGNLDPRAQLYQYSNGHNVAGVSVDYNHALKKDFGQWGYEPPAPKPVGPSGVWHFTGTLDPKTGQWTVQGAPGQNVVFGPAARRWCAEVGVREDNGGWVIVSKPFNDIAP